MTYTLANGTVIDGSGKAGFPADVIVESGTIRAAGQGIGQAGEVLDVSGMVVCPGFIDMHSHSALEWLLQPGIPPKTAQGITTEVVGVDGLSVAPILPDHLDGWRTHLSGLEGLGPKTWDWSTFGEYTGKLRGLSTNAAPLVGHGNLRLQVAGLEDRPLTESETQRMCELLEQSFAEGAYGLSTGMVYVPCAYADYEELCALANVVARNGRFFDFHMRYEGARVLDSVKELVKMARETGAAMHISHFKVKGGENWGKADMLIQTIDDARAQGVDITTDQYPYTAGSTMLAALLPPWAHAGGPKQMTDLMRSPDGLARIRKDMETGLDSWESSSASAGWDNIFVSSVRSQENEWTVGKTTQQIADTLGIAPFDAVIRLLLEENLAVGMILFLVSEEDVETIMRSRWSMFCTDGLLQGKPHPRAYGTFPRILGRYVRERGVLPLEAAIHKATGLAALRLGLTDRGRIAPGMAADICVFDPATVIDRATYEDPRQFPDGIKHVFVNGQPTVLNGRLTDNRPGGYIARK